MAFKFKRQHICQSRPGDGDGSEGSDSKLAPGLSDLYTPQKGSGTHVRDVADVLADSGKLTPAQLSRIRQLQQEKPGLDVSNLIQQLQFASADEALMARAALYGFEFRKIEPQDVDKDAFEKLGLDYVKNNRVMSIAVENDTLVVATNKPGDVFAIDDVKRRTGMDIRVVVCSQEDINEVCQALDESKWEYCVNDIIQDIAHSEVELIQDTQQDAEDLEKIAGESPIINFVNYLITHAIRQGASDIHIEPKKNYSKIRYRIDGVLFDSVQLPAGMHSAVVSRLKIMSNLDISERRLPQDGRITAVVGGREVDLRLSTLPTSFGEKVVIRVLDSESILLGLEQLGMEPETLSVFMEQIHRPHGIILVTGPTGSGKTTTLYSALNEMDSDKLNISTVEDPVECQFTFCNQIQVNEKVGLTFAAALRSLLRQDPDVMMIGEIRDKETARIAVQAALTGHLVLSTLHTNDAPSSITRLVDIGIEPYLIAASLNAVLAQRLVRKICPGCKAPLKVPKNAQNLICKDEAGRNPAKVFHGKGCQNCRDSGYAGRIGIYELLVVDQAFSQTISNDPTLSNMQQAFVSSGQASLRDDGMEKVRKGLTTIEEVLRVTEGSGSSPEDVFSLKNINAG